MISGFNTDIEFDGKMYHVQTEDKGAPSLLIVSLVYDGGTILASKRDVYDDLANGNFDEKKLADRVGRQHKLICAAVKAGRIDELKEMTAKASTAAGNKKQKKIVETVAVHAEPAMAYADAAIPTPMPSTAIPSSFLTPERPKFDTGPIRFSHEPVIEDVGVIDEADVIPAEAVAVVSELSGRERPSNKKLSLELLGDATFKGGERTTVYIMICRGTERKVVHGAQIMIKVLGSSFRPVIFHAKSDSNGLANIHLQLPSFQAGRAALFIRAIADGEEVELRRIVNPG